MSLIFIMSFTRVELHRQQPQKTACLGTAVNHFPQRQVNQTAPDGPRGVGRYGGINQTQVLAELWMY